MKYRGQSQHNALTAHSILSVTRRKKQCVVQYPRFQSSHCISDGNLPRALGSMSCSFCLSSPLLKSENNVYIVQSSFTSIHTFESLFPI